MDLVALNGVKGWEMARSKVLPAQTLGHELRYLEPRQKPCMGAHIHNHSAGTDRDRIFLKLNDHRI